MLPNGEAAPITGAGRGTGRAIALCFAREGARIVLAGRDVGRLVRVAREIQAAGGQPAAFSLDVTRCDDAARVVGEVIGTLGRTGLMVNNSGVITYETPLWATTLEQWDEVMNTNCGECT